MEKLEVEKAQPKAVQTYNEDRFYAIAEKVAHDIAIPTEELPLIKQKAMSFYLAFKQVTDADKCTRESIETAFRDAIESKLDLSNRKTQAYLIKYGNSLVFQPSYKGRKRVALENNPNLADIRSQIIYEGDVFVDKILPNGKTILVKHDRPPFDKRTDKMIGGYGIAIYKDGSSEIFELTMSQILKSWSKSRNGGQVQKDHPMQMAKRTLESYVASYLAGSTTDTFYMNDYDIVDDHYDNGGEDTTYDIPLEDENEEIVIVEPTQSESAVENAEEAIDCKDDNAESNDGSYVISYKEYLANKDKYVKIHYDSATKKVTVKNVE